jgi:hypothetical protein
MMVDASFLSACSPIVSRVFTNHISFNQEKARGQCSTWDSTIKVTIKIFHSWERVLGIKGEGETTCGTIKEYRDFGQFK